MPNVGVAFKVDIFIRVARYILIGQHHGRRVCFRPAQPASWLSFVCYPLRHLGAAAIYAIGARQKILTLVATPLGKLISQKVVLVFYELGGRWLIGVDGTPRIAFKVGSV